MGGREAGGRVDRDKWRTEHGMGHRRRRRGSIARKLARGHGAGRLWSGALAIIGSATAAAATEPAPSGEPPAFDVEQADGWQEFNSPFIHGVRQLTRIDRGFRRSGEGYFSPDGQKLILQAEEEGENPFFQIYVLDLSTGDHRRVSPGRGRTTCAYFRPGTDEVIFASSHLDPDASTKEREEIESRAAGSQQYAPWDYDPYMDVFLSKADGTDLRRLTDTFGYDAEGSCSPDGSRIVFSSTRSAYPIDALSDEDRGWAESDLSYFGDIYIMRADGTGQTRLTDAPGYDGGPFFSPDGRRIVWRHFHPSGRLADVFTMNADGSDKRQITDMKSMCWAPYYHPSSRYLVFTTNVHGFQNFELYIVDAAGEREPVRVTDAPKFDGLPVFSPDGRRICWTASRTPNGKGHLFIGDWDHEAALRALEAAPVRVASAETSSG
jgi:Tol biopolymer transport system component